MTSAGALRLVELMTGPLDGSTGALRRGAGTSQARHPNKPARTTANGVVDPNGSNCFRPRRAAPRPCGTVPRRAGGEAHAAGLADRARTCAGTQQPRSGNGRRGLGLEHQGAGLAAVTAERRPGREVARRGARPLRARLEAGQASAPGSSPCRIRTSEVRAERAAAQQRLRVARHSLSVTQVALAKRLQLLYEQGDSDPLAILLGAPPRSTRRSAASIRSTGSRTRTAW